MLACAILHNWIIGFGIDEHVPVEEGFTGSLPDPLESVSQEQDSVVMAQKRDAICNAMWEGRGTSRV